MAGACYKNAELLLASIHDSHTEQQIPEHMINVNITNHTLPGIKQKKKTFSSLFNSHFHKIVSFTSTVTMKEITINFVCRAS